MKHMPALFVGHGSPMLALEHNEKTETLRKLGEDIVREFGKPKGIAVVSAHWFTRGTFVNKAAAPEQIYDMYGFPPELYRVRYPVPGSPELASRVAALTGAKETEDWGVDHGVWTVLLHLFPQADIPVATLSTNGLASPEKLYGMGRELSALRNEGYLLLASGNIVHNLRAIEWDNPKGSPQADRFDAFIRDALTRGDHATVLRYAEHPDASYAVPTPDHFLPLLPILGAAEGESPVFFNTVRELGALSATGVVYGL